MSIADQNKFKALEQRVAELERIIKKMTEKQPKNG